MSSILPGVSGIVLCGGKSSRMGRAKAWLPVGGETMLARTVRVLGEVLTPVIIAAAPGQELPPLPFKVRIVCDEVTDRGPLGGLAAALARIETEFVFVTACDLPHLTSSVIQTICRNLMTRPQRLQGRTATPLQALRASKKAFAPLEAVVPLIDGLPQPLAAVYRTSILLRVQSQLAANRTSMRELIAALAVQLLEGLDPIAFFNINTPEDYQRLSP